MCDLSDDFDVACLAGLWVDSFGCNVSVSREHQYEHLTFEAVFTSDEAQVKCLITKCPLKQEWTCGNGRLQQSDSFGERIVWRQEDGSENAWTRPSLDDWQGQELSPQAVRSQGLGSQGVRLRALSISAEKFVPRIVPSDLQAFSIATPRELFCMATPRQDFDGPPGHFFI